MALALGGASSPASAEGGNGGGGGSGGDDAGGAAYAPFEELDPTENKADEKTPAYRDRIIAPEKLEPLPPEDEDDTRLAGAPRAAHVELVAYRSRFGGVDRMEFGAGAGGFWDTADYGTISAETLVFDSDRDDDRRLRGTVTVWQRGLRMPGGWTGNNGLGVLNTPIPELLRNQYRFFLPSVPMLGISSEWRRGDDGLQWQAGFGRGGSLGGALFDGFDSGDGSVATAGAQWLWSPHLSGAASLLITDGRIVPDDQGLPEFQNGRTRALLTGHRWQRGRDSIQLNLLASDAERDGRAAGVWLDARAERGRWTHRYGLFNLEPGLAWGAWPIHNDVRGGYYRLDFERARWSWNAGIDRIDSISGTGFDGWYGNAFLRYRASARLGYGGGFSARDSSTPDSEDRARSLQLFLDFASRHGQTRLQYDRSRDARDAERWQWMVDHSLRLREGVRLSLSAGAGELDDGRGRTERDYSVSAYGGIDVGNRLSLDGTMRWSRTHDAGSGDQRGHALDLNLGWRWQLTPRWSLQGQLFENRGVRRAPFALDPLTSEPLMQRLPNDRAMHLALRYDFQAGHARPVIGGPIGAATGTVEGSVFLDENGDGVRAASELPAADVSVLLDGRYRVRTDANGRFRFERVAIGAHELSVLPDNLPLPWTLDDASANRRIEVEVRESVALDVGARRVR